VSTTDIRAAHVYKPEVSFRTYYHESDTVEKGTPWFHTIQIKWNSEKDGSYASGSSITFTFHDISEVWDFAGKMAEANTQIVDCVMQEHKEFAESRIKQTAGVK